MLKILIVHTYYQQRGGEDAVFEQEYQLLSAHNEVNVVKFYNKNGWRGALQFCFSIWNIFSSNKLKKAINYYRPDIVHLHNWHYACGPLIIRTAKALKIPIVVTLHNYRLLCPSGSLMSDGAIFTNSLKVGFPWEAIRKKVFRNSLLQTFWLAFIIWFHKVIGTWNKVDKYITLTEFAREIYVSSSFNVSKSKYLIKPNFSIKPNNKSTNRGDHFLYIGRLSDEKGVNLLLSTIINTNYKLFIAGDGPLTERVLFTASSSPNITYLGILNKKEVEQAMGECSALIFPSIWFEGMPMTILEAFSQGTPVLGSNLGAMKSIIQDGYNGIHFEPGSVASLTSSLQKWQSLTVIEENKYRSNCFNTYESHFTPKANSKMLINIYNDIIANNNKLAPVCS